MDPVDVFVIVDAKHHGLIVPDGPRRYVEYGYGEWGWYALGHDSWYHAFPAVLWPTRGTIGRRPVVASSGEMLRRGFYWAALHRYSVERERLTALRRELEARFAAGVTERIQSKLYGFEFVPETNSYWMLWNCTDALAGWLAALGCQVDWVPLRVGFEFLD